MDSLDLDYELSMDAPFRSRSNTWPLPRPDDSLDLLVGEPLEPCPEVLGSCSSFGTLVAGDCDDLHNGNDPNSICTSGHSPVSLSGAHHTSNTSININTNHHHHHHQAQHAQAQQQQQQQHPHPHSLDALHSDSNVQISSPLHPLSSISGPLNSSGERLDDLSEVAELEELGQLQPMHHISQQDLLNGSLGQNTLDHLNSSDQLSPQSSLKKNSSRRNAWGNMSYADLITQAIQQSTEQRLTLSQIYEWMVRNVSYFKDKGDSNSSAGWKNSIRHNLSLHSRFMRVQNEGTGKSSWWMINPEAKPGKAARRRAASMETKAYEKRKGRVKKKVDALRQAALGGSVGGSLGGSISSSIGGPIGQLVDQTPSPCSSLGEGLDLFPDSPMLHGGLHPLARTNQQALSYLHNRSPNRPPTYAISAQQQVSNGSNSQILSSNGSTLNGQQMQTGSTQQDLHFRPRASSNASSCSRLSPPLNPTLDDPLSPITVGNASTGGWQCPNDLQASMYNPQNANPNGNKELDTFTEHQLVENMTATMTLNGSNGAVPNANMNQMTAFRPIPNSVSINTMSPQTVMYVNGSSAVQQQQSQQAQQHSPSTHHLMNGGNGYMYTTMDSKRNSTSCVCSNVNCNDDENNNHRNNFALSMEQLNNLNSNLCGTSMPSSGGQLVELLKSASPLLPMNQTQQHQQPCADYAIKRERANTYAGTTYDCSGGYRTAPSVGQFLQMNSPLPTDLDLNLDSFQGGFECDVDQVIKHELSVDGDLDFNFEPMHSAPVTTSGNSSMPSAASTHSWVH